MRAPVNLDNLTLGQLNALDMALDSAVKLAQRAEDVGRNRLFDLRVDQNRIYLDTPGIHLTYIVERPA